MTLADGLKAAALLFVAAIVQVSIFSQVDILGGSPQLVLVVLVAVSLLRGSIAGATAGFFAGLVVDTATLATLGMTSLVLTVSGYCIGRYGETTGRAAGRLPEQGSRSLSAASPGGRLRAHAPYLSVAVVTFLYVFGVLIVHFMLGERAPAGAVVRGVFPTMLLNLILAGPAYALVRRLVRPRERADFATEVQLLG